jgi:hypothetical protein
MDPGEGEKGKENDRPSVILLKAVEKWEGRR